VSSADNPSRVSSKLVRAATDAIDHILDTSSDLRELWDDDPDWMSDVYDLSVPDFWCDSSYGIRVTGSGTECAR